MRLANIWLADHREVKGLKRLWRRLFPRRRQIGELPDGTAVWLLELPFGAAEWNEKETGRLRRWLRRLAKAEQKNGGEFRLGLPLELAARLAAEYPGVLAAGRLLAAQVFVEKLAARHGSLQGRAIGLLGVKASWQGFLAAGLLQRGARVALSGGYAERLAAEYWRQGVALPVLSARKLLQSSDLLILLQSALPEGFAKLHNERLIPFSEPMVYVPGRFRGEYAFGMFPAGMAAAIIQEKT